jgi:hypothetical protein
MSPHWITHRKTLALSEIGPIDYPPLSPSFLRLSPTFPPIPYLPPRTIPHALSPTFTLGKSLSIQHIAEKDWHHYLSVQNSTDFIGTNIRYLTATKLVTHVLRYLFLSLRLSPTFHHFPPLSPTLLGSLSPGESGGKSVGSPCHEVVEMICSSMTSLSRTSTIHCCYENVETDEVFMSPATPSAMMSKLESPLV